MRNIGYRIRIKREWVVEFVTKYATLFNALEVKLSDENMQDLYPTDFVNFCNMRGVGKVSFHLPKHCFKSESECAKICDFIMDIKPATDAVLVTHFYERSVEAENFAFAVSKVAEEKRLTVAIENVEMRGNVLDYLDALKEFAIENKFKVCLDIPHLFISAHALEISQRDIFEYLKADEWWKENIVEFHLHDFNANRCHMNIGEGLLDFEVLRELLEYFDESTPIIIETTIQDLGIQGVAEVNYFLGRTKQKWV